MIMSQQSFRQNLRQIEGRNPVLESLRAQTTIVKLSLEEKMRSDERISEIIQLAKSKNIEIVRLSRKNLTKISKTDSHQGVIAWAEWPEEKSVKQILAQTQKQNKDPLFIILPKVTYEQNLGAVIRTAEAAGVDAIIVGNRGMNLTPVVTKVAMGATEYIPLIHENIFSVVKFLRNEGIRIVSAEASGQKSVYETDLTGPLALVIGDEHRGISEALGQRVDLAIKIPLLGKISSLNMSVAAGIVMYEAVRQKLASRETNS